MTTREPLGTGTAVLQCEEALVAGALQSCWQDVRRVLIEYPLEGSDFWDERLGELWWATTIVSSSGRETTTPVVAAELEALGTLDKLGGESYVQQVAGSGWGWAGYGPMVAHAHLVDKASKQRKRMKELQAEVKALNEPTGAFMSRYAGEL